MQTRNHKILIYQILPRIFGNTNTTYKPYGSIQENGCGKFNDITEKVLIEIKNMGFTHVWYIGVIEHATMTDYSEYGIKPDDPDVVKGRAGSPYAIKDYYDVDPDLAVDVRNRMSEYEALIKRTHDQGLKVIMDFVPNHVARTYKSDAKPKDVRDFGEDDDTSLAFSPNNDFYYIPGQPFVVPGGYEPGGFEFKSPMKDGKFDEYPAKGTGDDVLTASPSIFNWFETVKLNYGINFHEGWRTHFEPAPPLWHKMLGILSFWADKGIDAFRCDMVELVPMQFWGWVTKHMKEKYPDILFIGEAYNPNEYHNYLFGGGFDYLYDKVGLYDSLKRLVRNEHNSSTWEINAVWHHHCKGFDERMLRFLENHDEQRIACPDFAGDAWLAIPAMIVTATLNTGPVMVYFGQEVGEPAAGVSGFSGDDGRTTIFDYWGSPEHQKWMNNGAFDGGKLSESQKNLRKFYCKLLNIVKDSEAISKGKFSELMVDNERSEGFNTKLYIYVRYTEKERILVLVNFNRHENRVHVWMPQHLLEELKVRGAMEFKDMLSERKYCTDDIAKGVSVTLPATSGVLLKF